MGIYNPTRNNCRSKKLILNPTHAHPLTSRPLLKKCTCPIVGVSLISETTDSIRNLSSSSSVIARMREKFRFELRRTAGMWSGDPCYGI